ncbi:hypothetical protein [Streptomyces sp. MP131-18]|uniref:hypothetical protein n=1 Tax=Streptomyces sp. MP131-18 TaxID=1857892 RepID=UPI00097C2374|nr:hypothetical protein [Streptomyces sp. MP131-18]ONK09282.1 hypothetical protein STBA_71370 [Streptomyces sp. MP131-18]
MMPETAAPPPARSQLCSPCAVSWTGDEADCWNCGHPASTTHSHPAGALQQLLKIVGSGAAAAPLTRGPKGAVQ